jgi:hypothetical protein
MLQRAGEWGLTLDAAVFNAAACANQHAVLVYLISQGVTGNADTCYEAAKAGAFQ